MERSKGGPATGGVRFKTGTVSAVDGAGNVKVYFDDVDMPSGWLPVCYPKSQNDKAYWTPDVGEHVRCIMDEYLEDGSVLGSIYSSADAVPWASADRVGWAFKDGGTISYDRSTGELDVTTIGVTTVTVGGDANINVSGAANLKSGGNTTIDAPETTIQGNLRVKGETMLEGGVGGADGASTTIPGTVRAETDVIGGAVSLTGHPHKESTGGQTEPPSGTVSQ
ncbi:phage baseplate assembly protein V [Burkholderia cenocepacia]|uniref:phage baseplate assembly protein V n=1 Tax=Burkholderia cenocepacia TaxID=95486 RepID=UPI001AA1C29E|nr:phage baseplate assembly protein V [Burkholderia cenocepacia]MBO1856856.1 phage baseplate assembly protein V [Burkholderia cenocepacia]